MDAKGYSIVAGIVLVALVIGAGAGYAIGISSVSRELADARRIADEYRNRSDALESRIASALESVESGIVATAGITDRQARIVALVGMARAVISTLRDGPETGGKVLQR